MVNGELQKFTSISSRFVVISRSSLQFNHVLWWISGSSPQCGKLQKIPSNSPHKARIYLKLSNLLIKMRFPCASVTIIVDRPHCWILSFIIHQYVHALCFSSLCCLTKKNFSWLFSNNKNKLFSNHLYDI